MTFPGQPRFAAGDEALSARDLNRIAQAAYGDNLSAFRDPSGSAGDPRPRQDVHWISVFNEDTEDIPPFAIFGVQSIASEDSETDSLSPGFHACRIGSQNLATPCAYFTNGAGSIPAQTWGKACVIAPGKPVWLSIAGGLTAGELAIGDMCGPLTGTWQIGISPNGAGLICVDLLTEPTGAPLAAVVLASCPVVLGKFPGDGYMTAVGGGSISMPASGGMNVCQYNGNSIEEWECPSSFGGEGKWAVSVYHLLPEPIIGGSHAIAIPVAGIGLVAIVIFPNEDSSSSSPSSTEDSEDSSDDSDASCGSNEIPSEPSGESGSGDSSDSSDSGDSDSSAPSGESSNDSDSSTPSGGSSTSSEEPSSGCGECDAGCPACDGSCEADCTCDPCDGVCDAECTCDGVCDADCGAECECEGDCGAECPCEGDKNAIVPAAGGFVALATVEDREVPFVMVKKIRLTGVETIFPLDPIFEEICAVGTVEVQCVEPNRSAEHGGEVIGKAVHVYVESALGKTQATTAMVTLRGIRKGREGVCFPKKTRDEMIRNNAFWSQAHATV